MKIPAQVAEIRQEICARCPTPCDAFTAKTLNHADPCAQCPLAPRRWGQYGQCREGAVPEKAFGLGDAVAAVAQPIAAKIDALLGTNIKNCGGCKKRQAALNRIMPKL